MQFSNSQREKKGSVKKEILYRGLDFTDFVHNALDTNNKWMVILMSDFTFFLFIFGLIATIFTSLAASHYSKIDKEKKEETLKKKFFIED